jgi:3-hydroxyisobutyrate dehydrogenase-like beta-hydroxyacid dehydrogenase
MVVRRDRRAQHEGSMAERIAFVGLGVMGSGMAARLLHAGHRVCVFNRTQARAQAFVAEHGGTFAASPAEAARDADYVFICVGNDDHLRAVTMGREGVLDTLRPGGLIVDHTTTSAQIARELSAAAIEHGCGAIDAPVSGSQVGAEQGTLTAMVGGRAEDFSRVESLLRAYCRHARLLGPAGSGQLAKMVNQICIAGLVQALSEGIAFAERAGLDQGAVIEVLSKGSAQSWQMEHRHAAMIDGSFDFGFAVDWMRKDLGLALEESRRNGATLPVTALVDQFYGEVQAQGGQRWDTSSLISRLRK